MCVCVRERERERDENGKYFVFTFASHRGPSRNKRQNIKRQKMIWRGRIIRGKIKGGN